MKTRAALALFLSATALLTALATTMVQCNNHALAAELANQQRKWEMLSAANAQMRAEISAHVFGVPNEELNVLARHDKTHSSASLGEVSQ